MTVQTSAGSTSPTALEAKSLYRFYRADDEETLALLRTDGIDFAQGFHLGRPEPMA